MEGRSIPKIKLHALSLLDLAEGYFRKAKSKGLSLPGSYLGPVSPMCKLRPKSQMHFVTKRPTDISACTKT